MIAPSRRTAPSSIRTIRSRRISEGRWLLGLMLTSKDNVPGAVGDVHETEHARYINIGTGEWDHAGRSSEIRLDRIVRIEDGAVRREGAIMPMGLFSRVVDEVRNA